ncbi:hypothetical protein HK096_002004, partial [Nowakowskiella sp. JEL0078]
MSSQKQLTLETLTNLSRNTCEGFLGVVENSFGDGLRMLVEEIARGVGEIAKACEDAKALDRVSKGESPASIRAQIAQKGYVINIDMEKKIDELSDEVVGLVRSVKQK